MKIVIGLVLLLTVAETYGSEGKYKVGQKVSVFYDQDDHGDRVLTCEVKSYQDAKATGYGIEQYKLHCADRKEYLYPEEEELGLKIVHTEGHNIDRGEANKGATQEDLHAQSEQSLKQAAQRQTEKVKQVIKYIKGLDD